MKNCLAGLYLINFGVALSPGYSKPNGLVKESLCSKEPAGGEKKNPNTSNDLILN